MFIFYIPELNTREYIKFYNLSGTCELKTKLRIKSYDKILRYLRTQNIQDAEDITALMDYKTGAHISEFPNIAQYTQFTIIRHPLRKLIMDDKYYYNLGDSVYPPFRDEDIILFDDRDFVSRYLRSRDINLISMVFHLKISDRLLLYKKIVKRILKGHVWNRVYNGYIATDIAMSVFSRIDCRFINNKQFMLEFDNLDILYVYLPYELQTDIDIIYCIWSQMFGHDSNYDCEVYENMYYFLINTIHPDGLTSDLLRKCITHNKYLVNLYRHIPPEKLDKDIWTRIIYQFTNCAETIDIEHLMNSISKSGCMTHEEFMQILGGLK